MRPLKREFAVGLLFGALIMTVLYHCTGCIPREAKEAIADGAYAKDQLECVDNNPDRETIDACRRAARVKWGIAETVRDAGHD